MQIKIISGKKGKDGDPPMGINTKVTIDGQEFLIDNFRFNVTADGVAEWSMGMKASFETLHKIRWFFKRLTLKIRGKYKGPLW